MEMHHIYHFQLKHLADVFLTPWSPRPNWPIPNQKNLSIHIQNTSWEAFWTTQNTSCFRRYFFEQFFDVFCGLCLFYLWEKPRWCFQIFSIYIKPTWGSDPIWPNIFSHGWFNHHLETSSWKIGGTHARWAPASYKWSYGAPINIL